MTTILPDWLARAAASFPDRLALRFGGEDWTFAELDRRATTLARRLSSAGIGAGSRVALLSANSAQYAALVHALTRLGAVLIPLNTRLTEHELRWQLADVKASVLISDGRHAALAAAAIRDLPALPLYLLAAQASSDGAEIGG